MVLVPLDEVVDEIFDPLLDLRLLQGDGVALVRDLHHQFSQFVELALDLEETLCGQSEPEDRRDERRLSQRTERRVRK